MSDAHVKAYISASSTKLGDATLPVVLMAGELDIASADEFQRRAVELLGDVPAAGLVADLSGVTFADSRGIASLVSIRRLLDGRPMYLKGVNERTRAAIRMMRLEPLFVFL